MNVKRSNISNSVSNELEFDKVLTLLETFTKSPINKIRIRELSILNSPKVLNYHLNCLEEYISIQSDTNFPRFEYVDLVEVIKYLRIENSVLTEDQVFDIYNASNWVNTLLHFINNNEYETPNLIHLIGELKKSVSIKKGLFYLFIDTFEFLIII